MDDEHCSQCCHNYRLQWTPKKTEEIQVGDEVVEHDYGIKAVVYAVTDYVYGMYKNERGAIVRDEWYKENCTRTGKTYPELIKALAELPKEGE